MSFGSRGLPPRPAPPTSTTATPSVQFAEYAMPSTTTTSWTERAGLSSAKLPTRRGDERSAMSMMS